MLCASGIPFELWQPVLWPSLSRLWQVTLKDKTTTPHPTPFSEPLLWFLQNDNLQGMELVVSFPRHNRLWGFFFCNSSVSPKANKWGSTFDRLPNLHMAKYRAHSFSDRNQYYLRRNVQSHLWLMADLFCLLSFKPNTHGPISKLGCLISCMFKWRTSACVFVVSRRSFSMNLHGLETLWSHMFP